MILENLFLSQGKRDIGKRAYRLFCRRLELVENQAQIQDLIFEECKFWTRCLRFPSGNGQRLVNKKGGIRP